MHNTSTDIGAYVRTVSTSNAIQGYPPVALSAGTDHGDPFNVDSAKSCVLTLLTGAATGTPTTQSVKASLESAMPTGSTWVDVEDTEIELTTDEKAKELDYNLTKLTSGHTRVRVKVVVAFTGGSSPKQSVAANVVLAGFANLPV